MPIAVVFRWYLREYVPDEMNPQWLEQYAERMETASEKYIRPNDELFLLKEAFYEAKKEKSIDNIPQVVIEEIYNWANEKFTEYK